MIDLMMYVILPAAGLLTISFMILRQLRIKEQQRKQDDLAKRINDTKVAYKTTLEMFSVQRVIRPAHVQSYYAIINNYFANQEITEENAKKMERLANRIAITISKEVNMSKNRADSEWLKKKLLNFAIMLPNKSNEYTETFYQTRVKQMLRALADTRSSFIQRHAQAA